MPDRVDIGWLGEKLRRQRLNRELTLKEVAEQTDISIATLSRIERGAAKEIESKTLLALADWMDVDVEKLQEKPKAVTRKGKIIEDTPDIVEYHLRADKNVDGKTARALSTLFRTAYDQVAKKSGKG